ncbi:hypothetical protein JCM11251_002682 [Rhodosporidiobolus azoricus]
MSRPSDFLTFTSRDSASTPSLTPSSSSHRSALPPPRTSLLLTDTLASPAQFAIAHYLQRLLRPLHGVVSNSAAGMKGKGKEGGRRVVLVGVGEKEEYWAALLRKHSIQLPAESTAGRFSYIDATSPSTTLSSLYTSLSSLLRLRDVQDGVEEEWEGPLVILDDVSALLWRGEGAREVVRWWKAVRGAVDATNSSMITVLHADSLSPSFPPTPSPSTPFEEPDDQYLFRQIVQQCDVWVEVAGLMTGGGTGGTRGEITLHRAPSLLEQHFIVDSSPPLQYRLEDNGAQYEVKGLGRFL